MANPLAYGVDLLKLSEAEMRDYRGSKLSMILQDPMASLNPVYTVGEQVAEPLRQHQNLSGKALWDQVTEALRLLRGAYRSRPDPEIAAHLGEVLWINGDRDEAKRVWREARTKDSANDVLRETLARLRVGDL